MGNRTGLMIGGSRVLWRFYFYFCYMRELSFVFLVCMCVLLNIYLASCYRDNGGGGGGGGGGLGGGGGGDGGGGDGGGDDCDDHDDRAMIAVIYDDRDADDGDRDRIALHKGPTSRGSNRGKLQGGPAIFGLETGICRTSADIVGSEMTDGVRAVFLFQGMRVMVYATEAGTPLFWFRREGCLGPELTMPAEIVAIVHSRNVYKDFLE